MGLCCVVIRVTNILKGSCVETGGWQGREGGEEGKINFLSFPACRIDCGPEVRGCDGPLHLGPHGGGGAEAGVCSPLSPHLQDGSRGRVAKVSERARTSRTAQRPLL